MKRTGIYIFIVTVIIATSVCGQTKKGHVVLKNGSVIKGRIYQDDSNDEVRIFSAGNTWVFHRAEIDKMAYNRDPVAVVENDTLFSKFSLHTEVGVLAGSSENSQSAPFTFHSSVNYALTNKLSVGVGSGVEFLKETHIPVFANIEYKFRSGGFSPYLFLQGGYCIPAEDAENVYPDVYPYYSYSSIWPGPWYQNSEDLEAKGGLMINPGVGFMRMFSPYFGMTFSFGYRFSRLSYSGDNDYQIDLDYNRLSLKLGIIFK